MARSPQIPTFTLYGEHGVLAPVFAHIETIAARSSLHDWEIAPHRHATGVQLLLVQKGQVAVMLDGGGFTLDGPCHVLVPAGVVHGFGFVPETSGHVLTLSSAFAARSPGTDDPLRHWLTHGSHGPIPPAAARRCGWLAQELLALARDWNAPDPLFLNLAEALLRSLGTAPAIPREGTPDLRLTRFRHLVESHLRERRPVAFYADALGLTPRTLSRLCAQRLGCTPLDLINSRTAIEAQRLLRYTNASVTQVADELGFVDPSYFSRFYLRMTGQRPGAEQD